MFELKYGNKELPNIWIYNQVKLVLAVFLELIPDNIT